MKRIALIAWILAGCANEAVLRNRNVDAYRSRDAFLRRETEEFLSDHPVEDLASLEQLWTEAGEHYPPPRTEAGALLQTALVEIARNRAEKLYRASMPYARASSPKNGAYYLAMAEASRRFADTIALGDRQEKPPDREQLREALQALEREAFERFAHDPSSRAIVLSAQLKEARELLDRGSLAGATLTLLETRRDASPHARGKIEVAGNTTLHAAFRNEPAALALLDTLTSRPHPHPAIPPAAVTVTLVRWPYTCGLSDPASLLTQDIVRQFGTQVRFVVQDFGASPLAERFAVDKYPAVFVDDVLVARPEDFHEWGGAGAGRYVPWKDPEQRREFQHDLAKKIKIRLASVN